MSSAVPGVFSGIIAAAMSAPGGRTEQVLTLLLIVGVLIVMLAQLLFRVPFYISGTLYIGLLAYLFYQYGWLFIRLAGLIDFVEEFLSG